MRTNNVSFWGGREGGFEMSNVAMYPFLFGGFLIYFLFHLSLQLLDFCYGEVKMESFGTLIRGVLCDLKVTGSNRGIGN